MKSLLVTLTLLFICLSLYSNPISPKLISEMWFNSEGHLMMEMSSYYSWDIDVTNLYFINGDITAQLPETFLLPGTTGTVIADITELMPTLSFNPEADTLVIKERINDDWFYELESISWGSSFVNDINPLLPGQSWVQHMKNSTEGAFFSWCKDAVATPGMYPFQSQSRAGINLSFTDQNGNPVPNVRYYAGSAIGFTDQTGTVIDTLFTGKLQVRYFPPGSSSASVLPEVWIEPDQVYNQTVQLTVTENADHTTSPALRKGLSVYPSPVNLSSMHSINVEYQGQAHLKSGSLLKLYNAKGQFVSEVSMPANGKLSWQPSRELSPGHYLLRLISGNRIIDSTSISVVK